MGDRGNVRIVGPDFKPKGVWFYTHWNGGSLDEIVAQALTRGQERWDDPTYLARIIFCDLVKGFERTLTGFGISTSIGDNEGNRKVLTVDTKTQTVYKQYPGNYVSTTPKTYRLFIKDVLGLEIPPTPE
jgi:hypothetical protein